MEAEKQWGTGSTEKRAINRGCYYLFMLLIAGCSKEFSRPDKLKAHIVAHSGVKPYQCQICERTFTRRQHLRDHERVHAQRPWFQCECCNQGFAQLSSLKRHRCTDVTSSTLRPRKRALRRKVGRPRKNVPLLAVEPDSVTAEVKEACKRHLLIVCT